MTEHSKKSEKRKAIDRLLELERLPSTEENVAEWRSLHDVIWGDDTVIDGGHQDKGEDLP